MASLTPRHAKFVNSLIDGDSKGDAAIIAGYPPQYASSIASQLLKNAKIKAALDKAGLTDKFIADKIKRHINDGMSVKPTAETSLRALELATKLKGYHDTKPDVTNNNQTNVFIMELKELDDSQLNTKLKALLSDVNSLT